MSTTKCKNCGCSEIDVDPARGDAVCTSCGSVLESSIIVSSVQFEDNAHGGSTAIGQFVSSDSKGGARGFGGSFHTGLGIESKEVTLRNAKKKITDLAHQMRLNQHCIEIAFNFFKMALSRHLTRGRKTGNVVAACVYMTCRMEGTAHMLIDFCDVLDTVGVYELGRTYLKLSQALCINIPALDPSLYILRFANRLEFGNKTHQVSMTALRLVQRMKRDSMHTGRRPSGLCGAGKLESYIPEFRGFPEVISLMMNYAENVTQTMNALMDSLRHSVGSDGSKRPSFTLLMAARLHEFNRSVSDIIKIVKVHESTLRKRLLEFGETPSSSLSLDEFMTVDLEEEQDPPSFKAARKKDHHDRFQKIIDGEEMGQNLTALQMEIEKELREISSRKRSSSLKGVCVEDESENRALNNFVQKSTMEAIEECMNEPGETESETTGQGLPPSFSTLGLNSECISTRVEESPATASDGELIADDLDDEELNQYIMTDREAKFKDSLWMKINEDYLQQQKEREEKLAKEREGGKPEKKRKKYSTKKSKNAPAANSAGEAFEKMLQEKKMSTKINYEVLKSLTLPKSDETMKEETIFSRIQTTKTTAGEETKEMPKPSSARVTKEKEADQTEKETDVSGFPDEGDEDMEDGECDAITNEISLSQLLNRHGNDGEVEDYGEDYDEEDY